MRILVVDDEVDVCQTIKMMLTQLGYTNETVTSGGEALRKCSEQSFDVILTDLGMPGINGLELAQQVKTMTPSVRIILITGWPLQLTPEQLSQYGIESVINKPIRLKELLSALTTNHPDISSP